MTECWVSFGWAGISRWKGFDDVGDWSALGWLEMLRSGSRALETGFSASRRRFERPVAVLCPAVCEGWMLA